MRDILYAPGLWLKINKKRTDNTNNPTTTGQQQNNKTKEIPIGYIERYNNKPKNQIDMNLEPMKTKRGRPRIMIMNDMLTLCCDSG